MKAQSNSFTRVMWDGSCSIVRDKRRARYCLKQLRLITRSDASRMMKWLDDMDAVLQWENDLWDNHRYMIEMLYRSMVLRQPVPAALQR
jgi:hypothetical protein